MIRKDKIYTSPIERFLRKHNMKLNDLAKEIGCTRQTLWKLKKCLPITPEIAYKVFKFTEGEVAPAVSPQGRKKKDDDA